MLSKNKLIINTTPFSISQFNNLAWLVVPHVNKLLGIRYPKSEHGPRNLKSTAAIAYNNWVRCCKSSRKLSGIALSKASRQFKLNTKVTNTTKWLFWNLGIWYWKILKMKTEVSWIWMFLWYINLFNVATNFNFLWILLVESLQNFYSSMLLLCNYHYVSEF